MRFECFDSIDFENDKVGGRDRAVEEGNRHRYWLSMWKE